MTSMAQSDTTEPASTAKYIHEDGVSASLADLTVNSEGSVVDSGSSIEEEEVDLAVSDASAESGEAESSIGDSPGRLEEFAHLDQRQAHLGEEDDSEDSDWAVDDEDWELANGGEPGKL